MLSEGGERPQHNAKFASGADEVLRGVLVSDLMALGVLRAVRGASYRVPQDVSIVGFDDIDFMSLLEPMLTTVHVPRYEMGVECAKLLPARMQGGSQNHHTVFPTELVVRDSTAFVQ